MTAFEVAASFPKCHWWGMTALLGRMAPLKIQNSPA
jgi:hypothetical protein